MWLSDPKTKEGSVTLTLLVVSFVVVMVLSVCEALGKVKGVSASLEVMYTFSALYLGRRMNIKGNSFEVSQSQGNEAQKEIP